MGVNVRERVTNAGTSISGFTASRMGRTATSSPGKPGQPSQRKTKQVKRIVAKSVSPDENHPHKERRNEPHPATIAKHGRKYLWGFAKQIVTLGNSDEHKNLRSDNESTILGRGTIVVVPPEVVRANQAAHGGNYEQALNSYTADEKPRRRAIFLGAVVMAGTTSLLFNAPLPLHVASDPIRTRAEHLLADLCSSSSSLLATRFEAVIP